MISVNFTAVILATIVAFVMGFLFHGPLTGKLWMKLAEIHPTGNEKFKDMVPQLIWNFVVQFVTAFVLAVIYLFAAGSPHLGGPGIGTGIVLSCLIWLGFLVTSSSIEVIWMGRKFTLWLFETVCSLIVMVTMGAIIATF